MKKLKFYRLFCEKTQRELAKEVGCTQPLISMFENEKLYHYCGLLMHEYISIYPDP